MNALQRRILRRKQLRQAANFQIKLARRESNGCQYKPIEVGHFSFSIQGSEFHYSSPRRRTLNIVYTEMELAIFDKKGNWCVLSDADSAELKVHFEHYGRSNDVAPYTKVGNIQEMLNRVALGTVKPMRIEQYWAFKDADKEIEAVINGMDV